MREHRFVHAKDIQVGDWLCSKTGSLGTVQSVLRHGGRVRVEASLGHNMLYCRIWDEDDWVAIDERPMP